MGALFLVGMILPVIVWVHNYVLNHSLNHKFRKEYLFLKQIDSPKLDALKEQYRAEYSSDIHYPNVLISVIKQQDTERAVKGIGNMTLILLCQFAVYLVIMFGFYILTGTDSEQKEWDKTDYHTADLSIPTSPDDDFYTIWGIGMFLCFVPLTLYYIIYFCFTILVHGIDALRKSRNCNLTSRSYFLIDEFIHLNQNNQDELTAFSQALKDAKMYNAYKYAQQEIKRLNL